MTTSSLPYTEQEICKAIDSIAAISRDQMHRRQTASEPSAEEKAVMVEYLSADLAVLQAQENAQEKLFQFDDLECFYDDPETTKEVSEEYIKRRLRRMMIKSVSQTIDELKE